MNLVDPLMLDENKYAEGPTSHPTDERFANLITAYGRDVDKREQASSIQMLESAFRRAIYTEFQMANARMGIMPADIMPADIMPADIILNIEREIAALKNQAYGYEREIAALKNQAYGYEREIAALKKLVDSLQELAGIRNNPWQRNNKSAKTLEAAFGTEPDDTIDTKKLDGLLSDYVDEKHDSSDLIRSIRGR